MRRTTFSLLNVPIALLLFVSTASTQNSKVVPCVVANGAETLCDSCEESKAIEVTSWSNATWVKNFTMPAAPSEAGAGYDVYWKVEQPADGCRVLLFEGFSTKGDCINPKIPGRIKLSVDQEGCYLATIGARGVAAGACCGDECLSIGAIPGSIPERIKREIPPLPSRIMRSMSATKDIDVLAQDSVDVRGEEGVELKLARRDGNYQNPDPWYQPPKKAPLWDCKAEKSGTSYPKSGIQQVMGRTFPCRTQNCDISFEFGTSVSSTVTSESSTTFTNSEGHSVDVSVGWMYVGPTASITLGYSEEFSKAVSSSTGTSQTDTQSSSVTVRQQAKPGATYNVWWAPQYRCQVYNFTCRDGQDQGRMEKCEADLDGTKTTISEQGIITTGS